MESAQMFLLIISTSFMSAWLAGGYHLIIQKILEVELFGIFSIPIFIFWFVFMAHITGL